MKRYQLFGLSLCAAISFGFLAAFGPASSSQAAARTISTPKSTTTARISGLTLPVAKNPIVNKSRVPGLAITYAAAENNIDPATHNPIADRLEITLKNSSAKALSKLEVFYEMTDVVTKAKEGYYQKLTGITIAPHHQFTVYFDGIKKAGHFPENQYSLYRNSQNQVNFKIWASAPGVKIAQGTAVKSIGSSEKPNS